MYGLWQALPRIPVGISVDKVSNGKVFIVVGMLVAAGGAMVMGAGVSAGRSKRVSIYRDRPASDTPLPE